LFSFCNFGSSAIVVLYFPSYCNSIGSSTFPINISSLVNTLSFLILVILSNNLSPAENVISYPFFLNFFLSKGSKDQNSAEKPL
jgi:hypothetical protein